MPRRRDPVLFSTDYDELVGCCDRVLILYDGADRAGARRATDITEHAIVASALNITDAWSALTAAA